MNTWLTGVLLRFVLRFWRPLLFSVVFSVAIEFVARTSPNENVVVFCSLLAVSGTFFELQRRRRRRLGLRSVPEWIRDWYLARMGAGVTDDARDVRTASVPLAAVCLLLLGLNTVFLGLLFAPTSFGENHPFYVEGRILCSLVAGLMLALALPLLAFAVAAFRSARFARAWARLEDRPIGPFSSTTNVLPLAVSFVLTLLFAGVLFAAAPAPTHAQVVAERNGQAAARRAKEQVEAQAELTRNVHPLGATASDGDFDFSVRSLRAVGTVPQEGAPPAGAMRGDRLLLVRIFVRNVTDSSLPPFGDAGDGLGVLLVDARGLRFHATDATFGLHDPVPDVKPHSASVQTLVFQLPIGDPVNGVLVWDIFEQGDAYGATYVYFRAGAAPAIKRLGPRAYGPSSGH